MFEKGKEGMFGGNSLHCSGLQNKQRTRKELDCRLYTIEGTTLVENDGCVTGLGTLGRKQLGMNWRYGHKEKVDKQHSSKTSIMGGYKVQGKNQKNFPLPNFTPAFTIPLTLLADVKSII